ncbi:lipocalin-like domain-containing protein [Candidatus Uabimicrobium amorphum]|uniref:Carotenoid 1,2-hydratase n=1 Tax=Uabimicrobium amorphum TaxID=2596890 RepID=A0A5S9ITT9_UABAM|nr:lipocalin-like domain-containing protein [Candidatus Uabimicrobium amorphum]BBM88013.1 carotenoid 1,2-hydratase [Candidatus Uabimicrobium amorphum]
MKILLTFFSFCCIVLYLATSDAFETGKYELPSVANALSLGKTEGFSRADKPYAFSFPRDEGPHPDFQTEWWYYTGNLTTKDGRRFGYQFTIFRRAISPKLEKRNSPWYTNQIYFAHFAVSNIQEQSFLHSERFSRGAMGLAGAELDPLRIWIENWSITHHADGSVHLDAVAKDFAIDLVLHSQKPRVLNGDRGLSQKSSAKGNASYYYSRTRLITSGTISVAKEKYAVNGLSWLDREWSTSVLGKDQQGWDWFSIQLEDGREIMLYELRKKDGGVDTNSSGTFILRDGKYKHLAKEDYKIEVLDHWTSDSSGVRYPAHWKITIEKENIVFYVKPHQPNQELSVNFVYWEGAVRVYGEGIRGNGYVELTGYK